jgi:hypothetical protein
MAIFAERYLLQLDLPYSEYWLPLLLGMAVGFLAIVVGKLAFFRKSVRLDSAPPRPKSEYDPFVQGSLSEQRKSYRRAGNPTHIYYAPVDRKDSPQRGWVLDRSMGGMCLLTEEEVQPQTILAVIPVNAPPMTPWVEITVCSCRACPEGFELGCKFVKTPAWAILLMFG